MTHRMRLVLGLVALGFGSLVAIACGGEVTPDASKSTSEQQTANNSSGGTNGGSDTGNAALPGSSNTSTGGDTTVTSPPTTATGSCWLDTGAAAPGECNVGDQRNCPADLNDGGAGSMTSSSGSGPEGFCEQKCVNLDGTATWSQPTYSAECAFYDTNLFIGQNNPACQCNTPLVLSFDNGGVTFATTSIGSFDLTRLGVSHGSDWPTAVTPWLAFDRNGNGAIDDGGELFGSATRLGAGGFAKNGFDALRELDANQDGVFDARDPAFDSILVWADANQDKLSSPSELTTLAARGVTSISLRDRNEPRCDGRGNCEGERASFTFGSGQRGTVIDVYLPTR